MNQKTEDQWPRCADHQDCPLQFILLSKKSEQSRLKCSQCLFSKDALAYKEEFKETFPLPIALTSPELMVNFLKKDSAGEYLKLIFSKCEINMDQQFNEQVQKFELLIKTFDHLKEEIKTRLQQYKEAQENLRKQKETFLEKCQFNLFHKLIVQLKEFDKQIKSDQYTSILTKINGTLDEMLKDNCSLFTQTINEITQNHKQMKISMEQSNHDQYQLQITQLFTQYTNFIKKIHTNIYPDFLQIPQFKLLNDNYFKTLQQKIEKGSNQMIQSINLAYLGSRDGLNANAFWGKINGKKNLLMVFKQQNNQIFGGYSPCKWQSYPTGYVKDDTLTSFLFSQNKSQIYPLKAELKEKAIYCYSGYGPFFGSNSSDNIYDLYIQGNFKSGSTNLGTAYKLDQQYENQNDTYLFGESTPNIKECEIYEILFS